MKLSTDPVIRPRPTGPPPKCGVCNTEAIVLSGLIGWQNDKPLCPACLLEAKPSLGWALILAERTANAMSDWPTKAEDRRVPRFLELLEDARRVLGPIRPANSRVKLARDLLRIIANHERK